MLRTPLLGTPARAQRAKVAAQGRVAARPTAAGAARPAPSPSWQPRGQTVSRAGAARPRGSAGASAARGPCDGARAHMHWPRRSRRAHAREQREQRVLTRATRRPRARAPGDQRTCASPRGRCRRLKSLRGAARAAGGAPKRPGRCSTPIAPLRAQPRCRLHRRLGLQPDAVRGRALLHLRAARWRSMRARSVLQQGARSARAPCARRAELAGGGERAWMGRGRRPADVATAVGAVVSFRTMTLAGAVEEAGN